MLERVGSSHHTAEGLEKGRGESPEHPRMEGLTLEARRGTKLPTTFAPMSSSLFRDMSDAARCSLLVPHQRSGPNSVHKQHPLDPPPPGLNRTGPRNSAKTDAVRQGAVNTFAQDGPVSATTKLFMSTLGRSFGVPPYRSPSRRRGALLHGCLVWDGAGESWSLGPGSSNLVVTSCSPLTSDGSHGSGDDWDGDRSPASFVGLPSHRHVSCLPHSRRS